MLFQPEVLTAVVLYPHGEFLSTWCSSVPPSGEEDVSLEFDAFAAAGWILDSFSSLGLLNATYSESNFIQNSLPQASHAHYKTSLLVKIIANLHFFGPEVCKGQFCIYCTPSRLSPYADDYLSKLG